MIKLYEKYLLTDKKDAEEKMCFHCHNKPAARGKGVCDSCKRELEAWRNKKNKKESEKE